ncbi:MAG: protein translocase subunit SecF [Xanthomonadales bacterium]|nr:protein translocase subunit SecF [Xanthomonadales bacterium]
MQILAKETHIDFIGQRHIALVFSVILLVVSIGSFFVRGLNFGLDFTGGTLIEVGYQEPVDLNSVRESLSAAGFDDAVVQTFGSARDIVVRLASRGKESDAEISNGVMKALEDTGLQPEMRRVEYVGPQVGEELAEKGGLAMLAALAGILFYIIVRFQWKFSVGAVLALVHDVILTVGFFSLLQIEFDLTVLAAVLAVIGYSLNDTIVVYDRIRENFKEIRKGEPIKIFNRSINQMLSRTVMTSLTTLLVLLALFIFGGEIIHSFAIALIFGVVIGTYSSIYVAATALLLMDVSKQDLMPAPKEGADLSHVP